MYQVRVFSSIQCRKRSQLYVVIPRTDVSRVNPSSQPLGTPASALDDLDFFRGLKASSDTIPVALNQYNVPFITFAPLSHT